MKLKIALIDDNENDLNKILQSFSNVKEINYDCFCFDSSTIESLYKTDFDLYVLDIDMPYIDGFSCAKKITINNPKALFVFYSYHDDLVFDSFKLNSLFFIRKQYFENDFTSTIQKINALFLNTISSFEYSSRGKIQHVRYMDIIYFEIHHNELLIHTKNNEVLRTRTSIKELQKIIPNFFMHPHASFLVNMYFIHCIDNRNLFMKNNTIIPISKVKKNDVLKFYTNFRINKVL